MDKKKIEALKHVAQQGKAPIDSRAVLELIAHHEGIMRAETFWSDRAPKMVDELSALRGLEPHLRALVAHGRALAGALEGAETALAALDSLRAVGKGST